MISTPVSKTIANYYEETGKLEDAALQRRSHERAINVVENRARVQQEHRQLASKNKFTCSPVCQMTALTITAVFTGIIIIFAKTNLEL